MYKITIKGEKGFKKQFKCEGFTLIALEETVASCTSLYPAKTVFKKMFGILVALEKTKRDLAEAAHTSPDEVLEKVSEMVKQLPDTEAESQSAE